MKRENHHLQDRRISISLSIPLRMKRKRGFNRSRPIVSRSTFNSFEDETPVGLEGAAVYVYTFNSFEDETYILWAIYSTLYSRNFQFLWGWNAYRSLGMPSWRKSFNSFEDETKAGFKSSSSGNFPTFNSFEDETRLGKSYWKKQFMISFNLFEDETTFGKRT